MALLRSCRDVTALVLLAEDRRLTLRERLAVRLHLAMCTACTNFRSQMRVMRGALTQWKHYRETDES